MRVADRILTLLTNHPMSNAEIRAALPDVKPASISSAIERLLDKGQIEAGRWPTFRVRADQAAPVKRPTMIEALKARMMAGR